MRDDGIYSRQDRIVMEAEMEYLIMYLICGFVVEIGVWLLIAKNGGEWHGWKSVAASLMVLPMWPIFTLHGIFVLIGRTPRKCAWCGHVSQDDDGIKAHIMVCELHPMRQEIEYLKSELRRVAVILAVHGVAGYEIVDDKTNGG